MTQQVDTLYKGLSVPARSLSKSRRDHTTAKCSAWKLKFLESEVACRQILQKEKRAETMQYKSGILFFRSFLANKIL